jgi:hypothetical protein
MATDEKRREIRTQVKALNDMQRRMVSECYSKCVPKPRDGELSIGEMACIDRCVPKYLEAHELVGKELDTVRQAMTGTAAPTAART